MRGGRGANFGSSRGDIFVVLFLPLAVPFERTDTLSVSLALPVRITLVGRLVSVDVDR